MRVSAAFHQGFQEVQKRCRNASVSKVPCPGMDTVRGEFAVVEFALDPFLRVEIAAVEKEYPSK